MASVGCFDNSYFEGSSKILNEGHLEPHDEQEIDQLNTNKIPCGLVSLENMFSWKDEGLISKKDPDPEVIKEYDKINVGSENDPKWIFIGRACFLEERDKLK